MSDIVERLRALAREYYQHRPHYTEAAVEIERLRAENAKIVIASGEVAMMFCDAEDLRSEIERLRAENIALGRLNEQLVKSLADAAATKPAT